MGKLRRIKKYLIVLAIPPLFAFILYPFQEQTIFAKRDFPTSTFKIEDLFTRQPSFKNIVADVFSISLFLDWYKVRVKNHSRLIDPACIDEDPSTFFITFEEGDPRKYATTTLRETTEDSGGYAGSPGHPVYFLETGEEAEFIAPSWENYSLVGSLIFGGDCNLRINSDFQVPETFIDFSITMTPYWKAWIIRLVVLYILWFVLLSSLISIWQWMKTRS